MLTRSTKGAHARAQSKKRPPKPSSDKAPRNMARQQSQRGKLNWIPQTSKVFRLGAARCDREIVRGGQVRDAVASNGREAGRRLSPLRICSQARRYAANFYISWPPTPPNCGNALLCSAVYPTPEYISWIMSRPWQNMKVSRGAIATDKKRKELWLAERPPLNVAGIHAAISYSGWLCLLFGVH